MVIIIIFLGWLGGALVNYLADILPYRRKLVRPFCLACAADVALAAWFVWPRACSQCGQRRSARTWLVEAAFIGATLWLWLAPHAQIPFLAGWVLLVYFGVVVIIDIEHHLILGPVSYAGLVIGGALGLWLRGWQATLVGGGAAFLLMLAIYWLGVGFMRFQARRRGIELAPGDEEALGFGDVSLSGVLGLLLGWPGVMVALLLAVFLAAGASLMMMAWMLIRRQYRLFMTIPYGPFLIAGAALALFFKTAVLNFMYWVF